MNDAVQPARWGRLLITGAAGDIGSVIRPALRGSAESLRLHDLRPIPDLAPGERRLGRDRL
jgi:uronate dehydrogenase